MTQPLSHKRPPHRDSDACAERHYIHDDAVEGLEPTMLLYCVHQDRTLHFVKEYGGGPLR